MKKEPNERPANLLLWAGPGSCGWGGDRVKTDVQVSIGRTDSRRALGFLIRKGDKTVIDFVLNRNQVAALAAFLEGQLGRLRKAA
jgi:hypothetical protein